MVAGNEIATQLLSKEKARSWVLQKDSWQRELKGAIAQHELISKYHRQYWFQKSLQQNETELLAEYNKLAKNIELLEEAIANAERVLWLDYAAKEQLRNDNNPFAAIDFRNVELVQTSLF